MHQLIRDREMFREHRYSEMSHFEKHCIVHDQKSAAKFFKIPTYQVQKCKGGWRNTKTGQVIV